MEEKNLTILASPQGTIHFSYFSDVLFNSNVPFLEIFKLVAGQQLYLINRDENHYLNLYHSSPGTDTRIARINLSDIGYCRNISVCFTWSPETLFLSVGNKEKRGSISQSYGVISETKYRIGTDGNIYQIGDVGVSVSQVSMFINGQYVLQNTALETWTETLDAVKTMLSIKIDNYNTELVLSNITLAMLVTGLETYTKRRFIETNLEGNFINISDLYNTFISNKNRELVSLESIKKLAEEEKLTAIEYMIKKKYINFQNYEDIKKAFYKGYGISFNDIGITDEIISKLKKFILYRHKIVHVTPMIMILNQELVPPEEPVLPKKEVVENAITVFSDFITKLHAATLKLGKKS